MCIRDRSVVVEAICQYNTGYFITVTHVKHWLKETLPNKLRKQVQKMDWSAAVYKNNSKVK